MKNDTDMLSIKLKTSQKSSKISQSVDTRQSFHNSLVLNPYKSKPNDSPGPGQYSLPSSQSGPKFSIYGKLKEKNYTVTPGPGTYVLPKARVICTKFSPVRIKTSLDGWEQLGPGTYSPSQTTTGPKWGFGLSKRPKILSSESPGPGSYNIPNMLSTLGFSIYPKVRDPFLNKNPGPGAYEPKLVQKSLKFSLYPRLPNKVRFNTPGPGSYSPHLIALRKKVC